MTLRRQVSNSLIRDHGDEPMRPIFRDPAKIRFAEFLALRGYCRVNNSCCWRLTSCSQECGSPANSAPSIARTRQAAVGFVRGAGLDRVLILAALVEAA